jgi:hypothetical protein
VSVLMIFPRVPWQDTKRGPASSSDPRLPPASATLFFTCKHAAKDVQPGELLGQDAVEAGCG